MRQSRADILRKQLTRDDILKEPITVRFSAALALGTDKVANK